MGYKLRNLILATIGAVLSGVLSASGSYIPRPPEPPFRVIEDSGKYELGKTIFAGQAELSLQAGCDTDAQRHRLAELQLKLPARVRKSVDLTSFAGKLSPKQLSALEYFLKVRHKVI